MDYHTGWRNNHRGWGYGMVGMGTGGGYGNGRWVWVGVRLKVWEGVSSLGIAEDRIQKHGGCGRSYIQEVQH